jgi:predicted MarR family transcription regulator
METTSATLTDSTFTVDIYALAWQMVQKGHRNASNSAYIVKYTFYSVPVLHVIISVEYLSNNGTAFGQWCIRCLDVVTENELFTKMYDSLECRNTTVFPRETSIAYSLQTR